MLTIIIASYNHGKYIIECLKAACAIDITSKILIIDDGSVDDTFQTVNQFIVNNNLTSKVEFIKKKNSGLVNSLNLGLSLTQTTYVYFTASDDIPQQGIKEAVSFLKQNSDINFVIGGAINFFETGVTLPTYTNNHRNFFNLKPLQQYKALFLNYPHPILIQSTVFKTEALTKLGGWDPTMKLDDYAIFIKLLTSNIKHNIKTAFMPDIICVHYRHHSSNSYKNTLKLFYMVRELLLKECPAYLINKSLGNITSYYLFCALRSKDREAVYAIIKAGNLTIYFNTLLTTFHKMVNKITK